MEYYIPSSSKIEETEIPLQWYAFEIALQEKAKSTHCSVLSREECNSIAKSLQMNVRGNFGST